MIITERELDQLNQLRDSEHQLFVERPVFTGPVLRRVPQNAWAFDQVADWRHRHAEGCVACKEIA
jgi:hypothetical protein